MSAQEAASACQSNLRDGFPVEAFQHPVFDGLQAHQSLISDAAWPTPEVLNIALGRRSHPVSGAGLGFAAQTPALVRDGLHYETRIFQRGQIATRERSWHDLFNALVWMQQLDIKAALNTRQQTDIEQVGAKTRTRGQCALTHFDEGGVIVLLRSPALLELWNRHQWYQLFWQQRECWQDEVALIIVGHALMESALLTERFLIGKCLVLIDEQLDRDAASRRIAQAIQDATLLRDPQELRPLPLSGIQRWHPDNHNESFHLTAPCYVPLRPGRRYPPPVCQPGSDTDPLRHN